MNQFYLGLSSLLLLGYTVASAFGWELGDAPRQVGQQGGAYTQTSRYHPGSGGYRSYHFWSWSFRGGK